MELSATELRMLDSVLKAAEKHGPVCSVDCPDDCMFFGTSNSDVEDLKKIKEESR